MLTMLRGWSTRAALLLIIGGTCVRAMCVGDGANGTCHHVQKRSLLFVEKRVCYRELGCFSNGPPFFHPVYRPLSLTPQPPEVIKTVFQLYTRRNRYRPIFISPHRTGSVKKSPFDPTALTRVLIHGFNDNQILTSWLQRMKDVILERADENVVIVDWSAANRPSYSVSVANSRLVGAQIAHLINYLHKTEGTGPESFHLIGHSLGAHIAGYAGERLHRLGRITGLDPAGPFFRKVHEKVRLDPSDAVLVDVIHSDPGASILQGFGLPEDTGDLDFFPAGGDPPGCQHTFAKSVAENNPTEALGNLVACQHLRANEFFIDSFNHDGCLFVGVECASWEEFIRGQCNCGHNGDRCAIMGIFAPTYTFSIGKHYTDRRLYLKVGYERPFCVHQYQVIIYHRAFIRHKSYGYETNYLEITVIGSLEKLRAKVIMEVNLAETHQVKKFLLSTDRPIGEALSATISIGLAPPHSTNDFFSDVHPRNKVVAKVDKLEINYLYPLPKELVSSKLCRISEKPHIYGGKRVAFSPHTCHHNI